MNLKRLTTFKQAYRLYRADNIIRVTAAYEGALERAWKSTGTKELFLVSSAKHLFPDIARRYEPVLAMMRGGELYARMVQLAVNTKVECIPGKWSYYASTSTWQFSTQTDPKRYAIVASQILALPVKDVPHRIVQSVVGEELRFTVEVETDEDGVNCLFYKPGVPWREIVAHCRKNQAQPRVFFWWLPPDYEEKHGISYTGVINPVHAPLNTPDSAIEIKKVLSRNL